MASCLTKQSAKLKGKARAVCAGLFLCQLAFPRRPYGPPRFRQAGVPSHKRCVCRAARAGYCQAGQAVDAPLWLRVGAGEDEDCKGQSAERGGGDKGRAGEVKGGCLAGKAAEERGHQQGRSYHGEALHGRQNPL